MAFNNLTTRSGSEALIPEEVSREFLRYATRESAVLTQFRRVPVGRNQVRFPVLSALPVAYWVAGDTGLKQTTEVAWGNKYLNIEEAATILPIPENVIDDLGDSGFDVWGEVQPYVVEAIGRLIDETVFFGMAAPSNFPTNVRDAATAAGNSFSEVSTAAEGAFFGDIDGLYAEVEQDGFDVSGFVAARSVRARLRQSRSTQGERLDANRINGDLTEIDGLPVSYPMRGEFPLPQPADSGAGTPAVPGVRLFAGDWSQFVVGVRQDITMKMLTEGVIQDGTGSTASIVYNLAQQDMVALRVKIRLGWQVANTINRDQPDEAQRYPAGVLTYSS